MLRHASHQAIAKVARVPPSSRLIAHVTSSLLFSGGRSYAQKTHSKRKSEPPKLDKVHAILSTIPPLPKAFEGAPQVDVDALNKLLPVLQDALKEQNFNTASNTWNTIKGKGLLRLVGRAAHGKHSRYLAAICDAEKDVEVWMSEGHEAGAVMGNMSLIAAAAGYPMGLIALMQLHIRRGNPEAVHRLFTSYLLSLKDKDSWLPSERAEDDGPFALASFLSDASLEDTTEASDDEMDLEFEESISPSDPVMVFPQILLCAIAAHAMQGDFLGAIATVLQTSTRISRSQATHFASRLPPQLKERVAEYANRLNVVRITARPSSLHAYLTALSNDRATPTLRVLYTSIVEELSHPSPWLTTDPAKVDDTTPVLLPDFAWALFLKGFLLCYELPLAGQVWEDITRFGLTPTLEMWTALLQGYAHHRMGAEILSAWKLMLSQGVTPDVSAYKALLDGLLRAKLPQEALGHFHRFRGSLNPASLQDIETAHLHGVMINGLLQNDALSDAKDILNLMSTKQPKPDIAPFNMFLRYYGDKGMLKELAVVLQDVDKAKLRGDVITFAILLSSLLKVRQDAPQIVFDVMRKQGVKPNIVMYSGIIDHLMKQRSSASFTAALEILKTVEQDTSGDLTPTIVTYTIVLTGILRAEWLPRATQEEWRKDITRRMAERKIKPTSTTYHVLIEAALENNQPHGVELAMLYYRSMPKHAVKRDTWFVLLRGLIRREEWTMADEVVADMTRKGFVPRHSLARLVFMVKRRLTNVDKTSNYR